MVPDALYLLIKESSILVIASLPRGVLHHEDILEVVADGEEEGQVVASNHVHGKSAEIGCLYA